MYMTESGSDFMAVYKKADAYKNINSSSMRPSIVYLDRVHRREQRLIHAERTNREAVAMFKDHTSSETAESSAFARSSNCLD